MKLCKKCEKNEEGCKCGEGASLKKEAPATPPTSTPPATGPTLGAMIGFPGAAQTAPVNKSEMKPGTSYNKQKDLEKGDQKGVHQPQWGEHQDKAKDKGESESGHQVRRAARNLPEIGSGRSALEPAKEEHRRVLSEMKAMPKPKLDKALKQGQSFKDLKKDEELDKSREAARQVKEKAVGGIKAAVDGVKNAAGWVAHQTKADLETIGQIVKNPANAKSALRGRLHRFANETKGTKEGSVDMPPVLRKIEPGMSFNELKKHEALIGKIKSLQKSVAETKDKELLQKTLEAVDDILEGGLLKKKGE